MPGSFRGSASWRGRAHPCIRDRQIDHLEVVVERLLVEHLRFGDPAKRATGMPPGGVASSGGVGPALGGAASEQTATQQVATTASATRRRNAQSFGFMNP
jgi:hypothetical protein